MGEMWINRNGKCQSNELVKVKMRFSDMNNLNEMMERGGMVRWECLKMN